MPHVGMDNSVLNPTLQKKKIYDFKIFFLKQILIFNYIFYNFFFFVESVFQIQVKFRFV